MGLLKIAASVASRPVSPQKHEKRVHIGHFDLMAMAMRIARLSVPMGKYDVKFDKGKGRGKPTPPVNSPYKSDDDARKGLKTNELPKKPPPKGEPARDKVNRNRMDPEYEGTDEFAKFMYDSGDDTFDTEDLQNLNFRTQTPVRELKKELEGYGLNQVERRVEKKIRGINDNPHGTSPFSGMSGGAAYQSVLDSKYQRNPFDDGDRPEKKPKDTFRTFDKE